MPEKLSDHEIRDITKALEAGKPLDDKYRYLLGTLLQSLAELANVVGTQRKRILQIEKKQEEREIALQEYYNRHLQRQSDLLDAFITPLEGIQNDKHIVDELLEEGDF